MPSRGNMVGRFAVELEIANNDDLALARRGKIHPDQVRRQAITGVVDCGATRLVLPTAVVKALGMKPSGKIKVSYADRRMATWPAVRNVNVTIQGRDGTFTAIVEPKRQTALVGAIVLEDLDFVVDWTSQRLVPRDPHMVVSEVE